MKTIRGIIVAVAMVARAFGQTVIDDSFGAQGTAGAGFLQIANQSSAPATPTASGRIFFNNSNVPAWINSAGVVTTFGTGTGDLVAANNLSDVSNKLTSINNITAAAGADSYRIGITSSAAGIRAIAIGTSATAGFQGAVAIGYETTSGGVDTTAVGYRAYGGLLTSVAIGSGAHAGLFGDANVFVGDDSKAYDFVASPSETTILATAIGRQSVAHRWAFAAGNNARARAISAIAIGKDSLVDYTHTDSIAIGTTATTTAASEMRVGSNGHQINGMKFNDPTGTAPQDFTFGFAASTGSNVAGRDVYFIGPGSTGSAAGGSVIFQVSPAGSSGSGANAAATRLTVAPTVVTAATALTATGVLKTTNNTASTSVSTGAFIVNDFFAVSGSTGNTYTSGVVNAQNAVDSTSTTTGSVIVTGGVGIAKAMTIGGLITQNKDQSGLSTLGGARVVLLRNSNGAANERQEIGFGNGTIAGQSSTIIGSQITDGSGSTNSNFYVATRTATTNTAPSIRFSIASSGEAVFTGTVTSAGIVGTTTNDAAAAGNVGELLSAQLAAASATSLTSTTAKTVTSVSLTAGDWEVSGTVHFIPANTAVVASLIASVSATDNTQASVDSVGGWASIGAVYTSGGATMSATPIPVRISLAGTTTYYLVATGTFSVSTCTAYGTIRTRRVR